MSVRARRRSAGPKGVVGSWAAAVAAEGDEAVDGGSSMAGCSLWRLYREASVVSWITPSCSEMTEWEEAEKFGGMDRV